jgi:hypothetical protein
MMYKMFKCVGCGIEKDNSEYKASSRHSRGFTSRCNSCTTIKNREARLRKNQKINNDMDEYLKVKLRNMRKYDRRFGIEVFNFLTLDDVKSLIEHQNNKCYYTGVELEWKLDADVYHKGSFDRIDTTFGHEPGNIIVSSVHANLMRGSMSKDQFMKKIAECGLDQIEEIVIV